MVRCDGMLVLGGVTDVRGAREGLTEHDEGDGRFLGDLRGWEVVKRSHDTDVGLV